VFVANLSAPFIPQFFKAQLDSILPYCDIIIGNETEAESYAAARGLPSPTDLPAIAKAIASLPKTNASRPRIVVITHGAESTILVSSDDIDNPKAGYGSLQ
jgi:adenosine kinase